MLNRYNTDGTCICKMVTNMPGLLISTYYESKINCTRCEMNFELYIERNFYHQSKKMKIFEMFVFLFVLGNFYLNVLNKFVFPRTIYSLKITLI